LKDDNLCILVCELAHKATYLNRLTNRASAIAARVRMSKPFLIHALLVDTSFALIVLSEKSEKYAFVHLVAGLINKSCKRHPGEAIRR
jgi:hypothetical protein